MTLSKRGFVFGMVLTLLGGFASAQKLQVNPDPLVAGEEATIEYSDPSKAGQTVTVTIDGPGFPVPATEEVEIELDANGNGAVKWLVPLWPWAAFSAPGCREVPRDIEWPQADVMLDYASALALFEGG